MNKLARRVTTTLAATAAAVVAGATFTTPAQAAVPAQIWIGPSIPWSSTHLDASAAGKWSFRQDMLGVMRTLTISGAITSNGKAGECYFVRVGPGTAPWQSPSQCSPGTGPTFVYSRQRPIFNGGLTTIQLCREEGVTDNCSTSISI